jgi:hypothetical protein
MGYESVTVAAGSFMAFKIVVSLGGRRFREGWYAPETRTFVRGITYDPRGGQVVNELVDYQKSEEPAGAMATGSAQQTTLATDPKTERRALDTSRVDPRQESSGRPDVLTGTTWSGIDTARSEMRIVFEAGGRVRMSLNKLWLAGTWRQDGDDIYFSVNNSYIEYRGTIYENTMNGSARNQAGYSWRWRVVRE